MLQQTVTHRLDSWTSIFRSSSVMKIEKIVKGLDSLSRSGALIPGCLENSNCLGMFSHFCHMNFWVPGSFCSLAKTSDSGSREPNIVSCWDKPSKSSESLSELLSSGAPLAWYSSSVLSFDDMSYHSINTAASAKSTGSLLEEHRTDRKKRRRRKKELQYIQKICWYYLLTFHI